MKKRLLSLFCAAALLAGLLPTTAFALDGDKAIMLGTSGIKDPTAEGNTYYTPNSYIYFGVNESKPIQWRVLDADKANDGTTSGMFLLSEHLLGSTKFHDSSNVWQGSDAQKWCTDFASNSSNFSTAEQSAMQGIAKKDSSETLYSMSWSESNLTASDKIFFLSARELADYVGNYNGAPGLPATYVGGSAGVWWLRSPDAYFTSIAGLVHNRGRVYSYYVNNDWAARPAFNLNLNSVLFTSAAEGGKSSAAASGGNQGAVGADAIFEIVDNTGNEWKLTLLDSSRNFSISDAKIEESKIDFSYSNAQTGTNEYISVVIEDNGAITHYGRILQLDGTTGGASGTASLTLPAGVTLDDDTKLYVFNEQYNGGEKDDTKLTDYGSKLIDVQSAVDTTAPTLTAGTATRISETTATVKFTSDEAGTYYYAVVESGATTPTIDTTGTGTACASGENTISLTSLSGAGAKDIYIVAKDAVGNVSETLKITIPAPVYEISADTESWDFGTVTEGYTQAPAAKEVTITNTGNQDVTVDLPTSTNYIVTAGAGFTSGKAALSPGSEARITVQPKTRLGAGDYSETLTISGSNSTSASVGLRFVVVRQSGGGSSGGSATPAKTPSQQAADKIESAKDGATVEITLKTGQTKLDKEVFEALAGRDVTLEVTVPGGVTWTVNGLDIPANANLSDVDMGVSMNTSTIPVDVFNAITGEVDTIQISLKHNGEFGFTLTLTAPLGKEYADLWANLYHYDAGALKFEAAARIGRDGTVSLPFTHASEYAIIIDDRDHTPKAFPFTDVAESDWFYDAVDFVYQNELMNGTSATTFAPDGTMTRAMLVTILHRQAGEPVVGYAMPFDDVAEGTWYTEAVRWAAAEGIVTGTSATTFAPDAPVTREQFATILYRYAQQSGADVSVGEDTNILSYADALEISEYAVPAMQWACGAGVVQGSGANLNPQSSATRAEAAAMLMRFIQTAAE